MYVQYILTKLLLSPAGPEKRPRIPSKVVDEGGSRFRIEFTTVEVGSYVVDVRGGGGGRGGGPGGGGGLTVPCSPLIAKAYDAGLIRVTDIQDGLVGELSTFRGERASPCSGVPTNIRVDRTTPGLSSDEVHNIHILRYYGI